ncbi:MAG: amino acid adenylation domain-containing protein, partial [Halanaerobiales bacterium]|nr:amino acid adenylation domain-containing protein [Halanaerobiales bacterium]
EEYWLDTFSGEIPVLNMPTDYPRPLEVNYAGEEIDFAIDKDVSDKLKDLAKKNGATLYMTLLAAYNVLLCKYTNQEDIIVGSPIAGRPHADLEKIIGMFVNTLALRNYPMFEKTFIDFLIEVKENTFLAFENQDYQFEMLIEKLELERDLSRNPLFDTMFVFQNIEIAEYTINDFRFVPYKFESKVAKFDLTLQASDSLNGINFSLGYSTKLFKRETIDRFKRHFINILEEIVEKPEIKISEIQFIAEEEKQQLLYDFNATEIDYQFKKMVHQMFEEQVEQSPSAVALIFENQQMTYAELNKKSNQLARFLHKKNIRSEKIVAIMAERSFEMIIGIIGVLKAGGAYLPIDPTYPKERIQFMLEDSQSELLLSQSHLIGDGLFNGQIISLDDSELYNGDDSNLDLVNQWDNLAYVIYTSGTTGKPKGVMIEHRNIANTINWRRSEYQLNSEDRVLQLFSYSFDGFVTSFFTPIVSGSTIVLLNEDQLKDPIALKNCIVANNITHFISVPSLYRTILEYLTLDDAKSLRIIALGGEKLDSKLIRLSKEKNPDLEIINEYGPTENSVTSTFMRNLEQDSLVTIGKPISNTKVYILDKNDRLVSIGVPGQICLSGEGIARGYLNRPELEEEKFVINPYTEERMYKTGDAGRWLIDGTIEFLGRIDHQVKIRGFRVETGEIESELLNYDAIVQVYVIDYIDQGDTYLVAYLVCDEGYELVTTELREYLAKKLPKYMIPSFFIKLEKMPVTLNGKVDRKALPKPDGQKKSFAKYVAPETEIEKQLAKIWSEVLGVEKIGINDNFYELGGHSIKAIKIVTKTNQEKLNISVRDILTYETIAKICNEVVLEQTKPTLEVIPTSKKEKYNKDFTVTTEYPHYFSCITGVLLEKLKYEYNYEMEKGYMYAVEGGTVLTCEYSEDELWPFMIPLGKLIGFPTNLEKLGVSTHERFFDSLEEILEYFDKRLQNNNVILVSGSTYFLNYSPDYHIQPEEWISKTQIRTRFEIDGVHYLILVDIREDGYLVYDSTYNYFGEIPKEDFHNALKGNRAMDFMKGTSIYENCQSYMVLELNADSLQKYDLKELGIEILQKIIDEFLDSKRKESMIKGKKHVVRFGLGAIEELRQVVINHKNQEDMYSEVLAFLAEMLNGWKYKYIFFDDFLKDLDKYCSIYKDIVEEINHSINQCDLLCAKCEDMKKIEVNLSEFLEEMINNLEEMYNDQEKFFIKLQEILNRK